MKRPPDWLFFLAVAGGLAVLAIGLPWGGGGESEQTPRPGQPLAPPSLFDPAIWVGAPRPGPAAGTAFSVDPSGVWLTARHVVEGCPRVIIVTAPGHGVAARVLIVRGRETAVLLTRGGAPALAIASSTVLRRGQKAFHPGFPRAAPGEAASELTRRATLVVGFRAEGVLTFAELERVPDLRGGLTGLSGAPVLDSEGRVLGVTVAEAPRRRRLYATTPSSVRAALAAAGVRPLESGGRSLTLTDFAAASDALRASLSVAEVECLGPVRPPLSRQAARRAGPSPG